MAIIICPECGNKISEYARECIHCGVPMEIIKELLANEESGEIQENKDAQPHEEENNYRNLQN